MSMEVELKLQLLPEVSATAVYDLPILAQYAPHEPIMVDLQNTYYDTDDCQVVKQGYGLRIREDLEGFHQTVKHKGIIKAGVHERDEWVSMLERAELDLAAIPDAVARQKLMAIAEKQSLKPVFTTHFSRAVWNITLPSKALVEMVLDQGEIRSADQSVVISEIELEVKKAATVRDLLNLAAAIADMIPVAMEPRSKAWRGYQLYQAVQEGRVYQEQVPEKADSASMFLDLVER